MTYYRQPFTNIIYGFTGLCAGQICFVLSGADLEYTKKILLKLNGK